MKRLLAAAATSLLLACGVLAQQTAATEIPTEGQVREFLVIMQAKQTMQQMVDGMKAAQRKGAEEAFKRFVPDAKPEQMEKVYGIMDDAFRDFPIDELIDAVVPIYQRHLTKTDLDAIIAFYKSPTGQKLLKEAPAMMAEGMQAGQDVMLKKLPGILDRMNTQIAKLADDELKASKKVDK